ncbi:MAG: hypothetical protein QJR12_12380 [Mycobacterium sp.]|uniref:hypothetical protein n=1 Tax=Mycobacterium sp. TaxID=1785 RepID=UPI002626B4FD|nr:hypothetical protein [Mycobacterium sp.]MDI3315023.1 hypothetical protein [Mycobacterium sp.]
MWCPSVSLSVWANAWLAGKAAPDDVLDALSRWAPTHSVIAYDAVAAGHTGLPWPDVDDAGAVSLLQTLRTAAGRSATAAPSIGVVLPVPGDVRGLPAGTQFERDALSAGEAVIVSDPVDPTVAVGLVPEFDDADADQRTGIPELRALSWTVYSLPGAPAPDQQGLGEAEYALRSAVRSAADALGALGFRDSEERADPRVLITQLLESSRRHRVPDHAPSRALRVLENAAHVEAIIAISAGLTRAPGVAGTAGCLPIRTLSSSEAQLAGEALRPLIAVVRAARMAAVGAILRSAWQG